MKTKLLLIAFIALFSEAKAQLIISSDTFTHAVYNETTSQWDFKILQQKVDNVFGIMKDMSAFLHANEEKGTLVYDIINYEYDDEKVKYTIVMQDENKKEYVLIIDGGNLDLAISYYDLTGQQLMDYYNITNITNVQGGD